MLVELHIQGVALIDRLSIEFGTGLTTITGETGAGKSLLLGALRLLLGERASVDLVAANQARARVQAVFDARLPNLRAHLEKLNLFPAEQEDQLVIRRELLAAGGSRHYINDAAVTLGRMEELGRLLVAIHGQNDQAMLLQPRAQLEILDVFGQCEDARRQYIDAFSEARQAAQHLEYLLGEAAELEKRRDFLRYQVNEIDAAHLRPDEEKDLEIELNRLRNAARIFEAVGHVVDMLYEGERNQATAVQIVGEAEADLARVSKFDPVLEDIHHQLAELRISLENIGIDLRGYLNNLEMDPQRLALLEEREQLIRSLSRKYGASVSEILQTRERLAGELQELENYDVSLSQAQQHFYSALERLTSAAQQLSEKRRTAAKRLERLVEKEMRELSLPHAKFFIHFDEGINSSPGSGDDSAAPLTHDSENRDAGMKDTEEGKLIPAQFGPLGIDRIEFYTCLNVGDEPRPLRRVASGGELSRIMLAIECVLAEQDAIPTLIFDEIDAGISGQAAEKVGQKLRQLAKTHQVLCITHLPQIAACGHQQFVVEKAVCDDRTRISVRSVTGAEREQAIAQMLTGRNSDEVSRDFARRLLERYSAVE